MAVIDRLRLPLVVALAVLLQGTVAAAVRIDGVHPDLMLVVLTVAAARGRASRGALLGFVIGIVTDLFVSTPFGLSALSDTLVGFGVATLTSERAKGSARAALSAAGLGSAAGIALYGALGSLLGQAQMLGPGLLRAAVIVGAVNLVLAWPVARLLAWASPSQRRSPLERTGAVAARR